MVNIERIDFLIQLYDITETINESVKYLSTHSEDEQLMLDVISGIDTLKSHMGIEKMLTDSLNDICTELKSLLSLGLSSVSGRAAVLTKKLCETVATDVSNALLIHIKDDKFFSQQVAEKIFEFCERVFNTSETSTKLLFEACFKSSLSMPMEAYNYTIKIFENNPALLSSKSNAHPGYVYRPSAQHKFEQCPICGGSGVPYYRSFSYFMSDFDYPHLPAKLWMRCEICTNLYTWEFPKELLEMSKQHTLILPDEDSFIESEYNINGYVLSSWCNILNKIHTYTEGKSLLEVGVLSGALIAVALEMGYDVDAVEIVTGIAHTAANVLRVPIWNGDFLNYDVNKTYSVITMGDVIEHITDPETALRNAYRLLKDDGVLWLSTPNFESAFSRLKRFSDPMWLEPHHITYFSYRGLEKLIRKCGFEVKEYNVSNRYNGSMELFLVKR